MGKTIMGAVASLDGFIAYANDEVGPLFDWYGDGRHQLEPSGQPP